MLVSGRVNGKLVFLHHPKSFPIKRSHCHLQDLTQKDQQKKPLESFVSG